MNEKNEIPFPLLEMGTGFVLGLSVGYALKKSFKILLLLVGVGFIFMILLENQGAVSVSNVQLQSAIDLGIENFKSIFEILKVKLEQYQVAGEMSAVAGFLVGIKIG